MVRGDRGYLMREIKNNTSFSAEGAFELDLMSERIKSGRAAAKARSKKLGRQPGQRQNQIALHQK